MAHVGLACTGCKRTINEQDWTTNNITQTTQGLMHKKCSVSTDNNPKQRIFTKQYDFDTNGIIYWLGTNKGTEDWINPAFRGSVSVTASSIMADSEAACSIVGRETVRCLTKPIKDSWFVIDLKNIRVIPTHYSLKHYSTWANEALRNWTFDGFDTDNGGWAILSRHNNDTHLNGKGSTFTWWLDPLRVKKAYSKFRISQFGINSNNHHYLALSGFELYGQVMDENEVYNEDEPGKLGEYAVSDYNILKGEINRLKNKLSAKDVVIAKLDDDEKKGNDEKQTLIASMLLQNNKLQETLDEYKQMTQINEQQLSDLNRKLCEKDEHIKRLQTEYYNLQISQIDVNMNKNGEFKVLKSKLQQTEILMKAYQNDYIRIKEENLSLKTEILSLHDDEKKNDNIDNNDKCKIKFKYWLCKTVKLAQYLSLFKEKEYNDIRMVKFLDDDTVKNEIGINKGLHRKLLLEKSNEFKLSHNVFCQQIFGKYEQLQEYKQIFEVNGILRMNDLKNDIKNKQQLKNMLNINDMHIVNLIWSIVHPKQQQIKNVQSDNEGQVTLYL